MLHNRFAHVNSYREISWVPYWNFVFEAAWHWNVATSQNRKLFWIFVWPRADCLIRIFHCWSQFVRSHAKIIRHLTVEGCHCPIQTRQPFWIFSPIEGVPVWVYRKYCGLDLIALNYAGQWQSVNCSSKSQHIVVHKIDCLPDSFFWADRLPPPTFGQGVTSVTTGLAGDLRRLYTYTQVDCFWTLN